MLEAFECGNGLSQRRILIQPCRDTGDGRIIQALLTRVGIKRRGVIVAVGYSLRLRPFGVTPLGFPAVPGLALLGRMAVLLCQPLLLVRAALLFCEAPLLDPTLRFGQALLVDATLLLCPTLLFCEVLFGTTLFLGKVLFLGNALFLGKALFLGHALLLGHAPFLGNALFLG